MNKDELLDSLAVAIANGNIDSVVAVTKEVIDAGIDPLEAVLKGATRGLDVVGERYQRHYIMAGNYAMQDKQV